jgi:Copine
MHLQMYHVMIILTDGTIHDMNETKDLIVELSGYPVSLIIIGVGKENFENMIILDGDTVELRNSQNKKAERDIV